MAPPNNDRLANKLQRMFNDRRSKITKPKKKAPTIDSTIKNPPRFTPKEVFGNSYRLNTDQTYRPPRTPIEFADNKNQVDDDLYDSIAAQPTKPRRKSVFIDDSAIESDGQGGDIASVASSQDCDNQVPSANDIKPLVKPVKCDRCNLVLSGPDQLKSHFKGKRCNRRFNHLNKEVQSFPCVYCFKVCSNRHDLNRHVDLKHPKLRN